MKARRISRVLTAATLIPILTTCGGPSRPAPTSGSASAGDLALVQLKDLPKGLDMHLSNGAAGAPAIDRSKIAPATKLGDAEVEAILKRTKPITTDPEDTKAFALRPGSAPAPRTGTTIKGEFPPAASSLLPPAKSTETGALRVARWMPEGNVPIAPQLSVTFSQPMVAITSQEDAAATVPVQVTPATKGKWRWIGTRTIVFDPTDAGGRFPMATTYQVEIPAGTKSATGNALASAQKFTFETPPPTMIEHWPSSGPQHLDVPMFVMFDQKIDPGAVLSSIKVTAGSAAMATRLLDAAEIAKNKELAVIVENANKEHAGRWLAFRTAKQLPADTSVTVAITAGTPSAEGPNKTTKSQQFELRTYPPLRLVKGYCGDEKECPPGYPYEIEFNNPLDVDKFDPKLVTVTPDVPGLKVIHMGESISLQGATKARTTYKVTVSGGVVDEFGQSLGTDKTLTWRVTDAEPTFYGPNGLVVLDPAAKKPTLDFFSTNYDQLKVRLYKVDVADYDAYVHLVENQWNHDHAPSVPGTKVFEGLVKTSGGANALAETHVDLAAALNKDGFGHAIAIVEPSPWKQTYEPPRMISWVQSTKLGLDAYVDASNLVARTTELGTGKPAAGVAVEIAPFKITGTTDEGGLAKLALGTGSVKGSHRLIARRGTDTAFLAENGGYGGEYGSWTKQPRTTQLAWYVIDDRKMYKPGEEVTLKGLLRTLDPGVNGDIGGLGGAVSSVSYRVRDSRNNEIAKGSASPSAVGGFDLKFTLPKTPNLGTAYIQFTAEGRMKGSYTHAVQVEEFRRPEFEVSASASQGPFVVRPLTGSSAAGEGSADITVNAKYYAGGPLPGAHVRWDVTASETSFTPPNRDEFTFGNWEPWWGRGMGGGDDDDDTGGYREPKQFTLESKTDATGAHILHLDFLSVNPAVPMSVQADASVTDVNRQTWSAASALIVHPSSLYVGLRAKRSFVDKGTPFELDVIGVDVDGKASPGAKIDVKATRLDWTFEKGKYLQKEVDPQTCSVVAAADPKPCQFATKEGGTYKVKAVIVDAKGRPNTTTMEFWVSGGDQPPAREVEQEAVRIIPDAKTYAPGGTAQLMLQLPFYPADALVSWRRSGIVKTERVSITGPTKVITVPISDAMTPNMTVQVDLVGSAARTDDKGQPDPKLPKRPAYAVGSIDLPIPPKQRTLAVEIAPSAPKVGPGEASKLALVVKDAAGKPVANAEATVLVVDEAVLSLSGYKFPNPIDTFYAQRGADVRDFYSRSYVKLSHPAADALAASSGFEGATGDAGAAAPAEKKPDAPAPPKAVAARGYKNKKGDSDKDGIADDEDVGGGGSQPPAIAIRSNFNPLAAFAPAVKTDASGHATVDIKLPDNLTRYRIVAIASAGDKQFGKGESSIIARLPIMVRPSPPRFLNFGDTFQLPVVVQNQTDAPLKVQLAARTTNARLTDGAGREVTVPANDRVEVQLPAAAEMAGTARFQLAATSGSYADAAEVALPVWTPATTEAFATYGTIDDGAIKQPVALPGKVVTQFGGIEVTTASTNLQALTDAMLYLVRYPYECAEQRSSRIMAVAALKDVLTAFKTKDLPSPAAMEASVTADIERLSQMQNSDGGFAYWDRGYPSEPYLTVYVTNALVHAKQKGIAAAQAQALIDRAKPYLSSIETHYPWWYGKEVRWAISAYALYTRKAYGDLDIAKGQALLKEAGGVDKVTMETDGWLLGTFAGNASAATERAAIVRHALNKVSETAGAANFTTSYGDGNYVLLASDRRVDAVMLESLIQEDQKLDLIPKVVTGLLAHRKAGRWLNTQENTFALLAMDLYFNTYEKTTPDFVARVWLGNDYAGDKKFKGRSTDSFAIPIPMRDVATHDKQALTIQKDGAGRLYYRIGMTYAPASLKLEPADYGFTVQRAYEPVDDPKDVTKAADGTWHVRAGARVRVRVTMVNENRRYHVALVDPIPAGFEPMNPALATTGPIPQDPKEQKSRGAYWWWIGPWYEHQNMRDERVEAFASLLWEGVHTYQYVARATTPGNFVVPPPKAEEMYMPETFGRGGSDRVVVE